MWAQGVWGLVLSLFGKCKRLVSRIPSSRGLRLGHGMRGTISLRVALIHVLDKRRGLKAGLGLNINRFFNQLLLAIFLLRCFIWALTKGLSLSRKNQMRSDSSGALSASNSMEILEVRRPMLNFFLLILGVLSNATPGDIHKNL